MAAILCVCATAVAPATSAAASRRSDASDRAATVSYLKAELAYERARVAAAPASRKAVEALGTRLGRECAGVVAGAERTRPTFGATRSPRQEGEAERWSRQWGDLVEELNRAIELTSSRPYKRAALTFARKVRSLKWSDAKVTTFEHARAAAIEWEATGDVPAACADMSAWVSSGFTTLSASTKTYVAEREAETASTPGSGIEALFDLVSNPLHRYDGSRANALSQRLIDILKQGKHNIGDLLRASLHIATALGVISEAELKKLFKKPKPLQSSPKAQAVIGKGRTAADTSYVISVESHKHRGNASGGGGGPSGLSSRPNRCGPAIGVKEEEASTAGELLVFEREPMVMCLSRLRVKAPRVHCEGEKRTIDARTSANARAVSLTLANGRKIVSRVALVPRRLGGPAGFYHQAVFVWASPPVSLTELGAGGAMLATVRLHGPKCVTQWPFTPRGIDRRIVRGGMPGGLRFSILATPEVTIGSRASLKRYGFSLRAEVNEQFSGGGPMRSDSGDPLAWQLRAGCQPREFAIVYGILKDPHETVWARVPSGLRQLRHARLPASLNRPGVLAYAALPAVPSELVVHGPNGNTVRTYNLSDIAREHDEICEGEAEPALER